MLLMYKFHISGRLIGFLEAEHLPFFCLTNYKAEGKSRQAKKQITDKFHGKHERRTK